MILWSEPMGEISRSDRSEVTKTVEPAIVEPAKYGVNAYHSIRRFVIVKEREGHSICL